MEMGSEVSITEENENLINSKILEPIINLEELRGWKDIMSVVSKFADFRLLLKFRSVSKSFNEIANREIKERMTMEASDYRWISSTENWFNAERCGGFEVKLKMRGDYINFSGKSIEIPCSLFEVPIGFKDNICRSCVKKKIQIEAEDEAKYAAYRVAEQMAYEAREKLRRQDEIDRQERRRLLLHGTTKFKTKNSAEL